jgi:transcription-repair coupling factor (superfamily II helicase)
VTQVVSPGEYAVRGGLIDLFPMGSLVPFRVDLFDDEIDSIRTFDPDTQRSLYPVPEVRLLPGREFPMDDDARGALSQPLARAARRRPDQEPHLQGHGQRRRHRRHRVLPAAVLRGDGHVFDYLGAEATVVLHGDLEPPSSASGRTRKERYRLVQGDPERPACRPKRCS